MVLIVIVLARMGTVPCIRLCGKAMKTLLTSCFSVGQMLRSLTNRETVSYIWLQRSGCQLVMGRPNKQLREILESLWIQVGIVWCICTRTYCAVFIYNFYFYFYCLKKIVSIIGSYEEYIIPLYRYILSLYALLKKPSKTQDQNTRVTENSIIHIQRSETSANTLHWAPLSMRVSEFSVTLVLWSCVTLGFSNSVEDNVQRRISNCFIGLNSNPVSTPSAITFHRAAGGLLQRPPPLNPCCCRTGELINWNKKMTSKNAS
jgi:hypothetical protein